MHHNKPLVKSKGGMVMETIGQNIKGEIKGDSLISVINTKKNLGLSASGKSQMVATTRGAQNLKDLMINLNIYKRA